MRAQVYKGDETRNKSDIVFSFDDDYFYKGNSFDSGFLGMGDRFRSTELSVPRDLSLEKDTVDEGEYVFIQTDISWGGFITTRKILFYFDPVENTFYQRDKNAFFFKKEDIAVIDMLKGEITIDDSDPKSLEKLRTICYLVNKLILSEEMQIPKAANDNDAPSEEERLAA
jgi:phage-related protein